MTIFMNGRIHSHPVLFHVFDICSLINKQIIYCSATTSHWCEERYIGAIVELNFMFGNYLFKILKVSMFATNLVYDIAGCIAIIYGFSIGAAEHNNRNIFSLAGFRLPPIIVQLGMVFFNLFVHPGSEPGTGVESRVGPWSGQVLQMDFDIEMLLFERKDFP